ncbi:unnamed protein product, partial [Prorocentrum cordatum]
APELPALPESEITAAEAAKRWANKALDKALHEQLKAEQYLQEAQQKVDECLRKERQAQRDLEEATKRHAKKVLPAGFEEKAPTASSKSVVHIEALLVDPESLELDVGETVDLSGPEFSDHDREQFESWVTSHKQNCAKLLKQAFESIQEEARKAQAEYKKQTEMLSKKRKVGEAGEESAGEVRRVPVPASGDEDLDEMQKRKAAALEAAKARAASAEAKAEKWLKECRADIVVFVETRTRDSKFRDMLKCVGKLGWCSVGGEADATEADDSSAGVLILAKKNLGLSSLFLEASGRWHSSKCARWCVATVRLKHVTLTVVPIYLISGVRSTCVSRNLSLLSEIGSRLSQVAGPLLLVGDWQMEISDLASTGFMKELGLVEVPSPDVSVTCTGGRGAASKIDYSLVNAGFAQAVKFVGVDQSAPWGTHLALQYWIASRPRSIHGWKLVAPRALDVAAKPDSIIDLGWDDAREQARLLRCERPARFQSNFNAARDALAQHDTPKVSLQLGQELSEWALALELVHCGKKGIP